MRAKLPWILLAVSLVANVFFAAGAAYTYYWRDKSGIGAISERLNLSSAQQQDLQALRARLSGRRQALSGMGGNLREAVLAEIAKPAFDRDRVAAIVDDWSAGRRDYFTDIAQDLHGYLATLTPEQRETFLVMARERGFLWRLQRGRR